MKTTRILALGLCLLAFACGGDDDDHDHSMDSPTITEVSWAHAQPCNAGTRSDVTITVTATDPDTAASALTYSGSVEGCTGDITAQTSTVSCPQAAPYNGSVTVSDPDGHNASKSFQIAVCADGQTN